MSSASDLSVAGKSFQLKDKYQARVTTRKTFDAAYFFDDNYKHEIANHYRDYKQQRPSRSRRRKQRDLFVRYRRQAFYGVISSCYSNAYRDVLPMAIHNFPRFAAVHTARGRRTLCETKPPDEAFNDTLRRIGKATSCEEFKVLVERQVAWNKRRIKGERRALTKQKCVINVAGKCSSDDLLKQQQQQQQQQQPQNERQHQSQVYHRQRRRSSQASRTGNFYVDIGDNYDDDTDCYNYNNEATWKPQAKYSNNSKLTTYVQLATEYYEQGFLHNIKYLQSIGERNARIKREQKENNRKSRSRKNVHNDDTTTTTTASTSTSTTTTTTTSTVTNVDPTIEIGGTATTKCTTTRSGSSSDNSRIASTLSNASISTETSPGRTTTKAAAATENCLWLRLRQLLLKQQHRGNDQNWATISVNIIPVPANTSSSSCKSAPEIATTKQPYTETSGCSVNDYHSLNAKFDTLENLNANYKNTSNLHELIDQLMQLDIESDLETATALLPKITLTDCSTSIGVERATTATASVEQSITEAATDAVAETERNIAAASSYYNNLDLCEEQQPGQAKQIHSFIQK